MLDIKWFLISWMLLLAQPARAGDSFSNFMEVTARAHVHRGVNKRSAVIAKVYPGAVFGLEPRTRTEDCPEGWFERRQGGFICGEVLGRAEEEKERPCPEDDPDIRRGLGAVAVVKKGVPVYRKASHVAKRRPYKELLKGSVLTVRRKVTEGGGEYHETRQGWLVPLEGTEVLGPPVKSLAVDMASNGRIGAIVTGRLARVTSAPLEGAETTGVLPRWKAIDGADGALLSAKDGFVALPSGGYVRDEDVSRIRSAPSPKELASSEKWIAVDLAEQLVHAYEGSRLIRVMPCSTGKKGNTHPGSYRIQKKLRRQDMHLRQLRVRVEDVQWVMYYDKNDGIAIHSAYWHDDFGTPVSHGCVNLPEDDARWLFDWTEPASHPGDSVRVPLPRDTGTQVVVFD